MDKRTKSIAQSFTSDRTSLRVVHARQSKLIGLWAASRMGLVALEAESYARSVVRIDIEKVEPDEVARKIAGDLANHGEAISVEEVHQQMELLLATTHHDWEG